MEIEILISTFGNGIEKIKLPNNESFIKYLIIHQNYYGFEVPKQLIRKDVRVIQSKSKGLSKSRNIAIRHSKSDLIMIMDDDVAISTDKIYNALTVIQNFNFANVYTLIHHSKVQGQIKKFKKRLTYFFHNQFSLSSVSSIDIVMNASFLKKTGIVFDEDFGLGSPTPTGEEYIFLCDLLKETKILNIPISVGVHDGLSSGHRNKYTKKFFTDKKRVFIRNFGLVGYLIFFLFFINSLRKR